jgi:hypothetical protein
VEKDGTILDISCVSLEAAQDRPRSQIPTNFCGGADVPVVGKAARDGDDWDMAPYGVVPETGRCKPLFGGVSMDARENERRRSCWNRLWEVPTAIVVVPVAIGVIVAGATAPIWVPLVLLH